MLREVEFEETGTAEQNWSSVSRKKMASSLCFSAGTIPRAAKPVISSLNVLKNVYFAIHSRYSHDRNLSSAPAFLGENREVRSTDLVALEYSELNLKEKNSGEIGHVRIRQHVNPLSSSFSKPAPPLDWNEVFKDPCLPLMVDIGSGSGRFLIWLANRNPDSGNYLGLEIREKLVKRAVFWVKELALSNIHFIFANATVSFNHLVSSYPGPLTMVSILCPDPHFKKRHHKRRVVQQPLVDSITNLLTPGGKVFIQSDVHEVAVDMRRQFDAESDKFQHIDMTDQTAACDGEGWLLENPMGIRTEREIHAEFEGAKIYRRLYCKRVWIQ